MAVLGLATGTTSRIIIKNITELVTGTTSRIIRGSITELATGTTTEISTENITEISTGTTGFIDTIIIIRTTLIHITDLTTNHIITVMVTTLTLGFTFLPTEPESISD